GPDIAVWAQPGNQAAAPVVAQDGATKVPLDKPGCLPPPLLYGHCRQFGRCGFKQTRAGARHTAGIETHGAVGQWQVPGLNRCHHASSRKETNGGVLSTPASANFPPINAASAPASTPANHGHNDKANENSNTCRASSQAMATAADPASKPA